MVLAKVSHNLHHYLAIGLVVSLDFFHEIDLR